jgi:hypothetical protein
MGFYGHMHSIHHSIRDCTMDTMCADKLLLGIGDDNKEALRKSFAGHALGRKLMILQISEGPPLMGQTLMTM